jgi:hypothetical protein
MAELEASASRQEAPNQDAVLRDLRSQLTLSLRDPDSFPSRIPYLRQDLDKLGRGGGILSEALASLPFFPEITGANANNSTIDAFRVKGPTDNVITCNLKDKNWDCDLDTRLGTQLSTMFSKIATILASSQIGRDTSSIEKALNDYDAKGLLGTAIDHLNKSPVFAFFRGRIGIIEALDHDTQQINDANGQPEQITFGIGKAGAMKCIKGQNGWKC